MSLTPKMTALAPIGEGFQPRQWTLPPRQLEQEAMTSEDEVLAYDRLTRQFQLVLHAGFVETVVNLSPPEGLFLDVGAGTGWISIGVALANPNVHIVAVDLSPTMLKVARANATHVGVADRITFFLGDATSLPFPPGVFDSVFSHNMMHHVPKPADLVREMARLAGARGALVIRDLKRLPAAVREAHVHLFGLRYDALMKKEYRDSINAALSEEEWVELLRQSGWASASLKRNFVTHVSLQRPAKAVREERVRLSVPWYLHPVKNLYR